MNKASFPGQSLARPSFRFMLQVFLLAFCGCVSLRADEKSEGTALSELMGNVMLKHGFTVQPGGANSGTRLVAIIGEVHPSVETQLKIADVILELRKNGLCDIVLVEGTSGRLSTDDIRLPKSTGESTWSSDEEYFRPQLEWGQIAGYEYAALIDHTLPVFGVEDMLQKRLHEWQTLERIDVQMQEACALYERGLAHLRDCAARVGSTAPEAVVEAIDIYQDRVTALQIVAKTIGDIFAPLVAPSLDKVTLQWEVSEWIRSVSGPSTDTDTLVKALNATPPTERASIEDKLSRLISQAKILDEKWKLITAQVAIAQEAMKQCRDAHFMAANELLAVADQDSATTVRGFFAADRLTRETIAAKVSPDQIEQMRPRDHAMVKNTLEHLKDSSARAAVLIVGAGHLEGIQRELGATNTAFLVGTRPSGLSGLQNWEMEAWNARHGGYGLIFRNEDPRVQIKETSRLVSAAWKSDQIERARLFQELLATQPTVPNLARNGRIYEQLAGNSDRILFVSEWPLDRNDAKAFHVLDRGEVPGQRNQYYQVIDRGIGRELTKRLSNEQCVFVYQKVTSENGTKRTRFCTNDKDLSFEEFRKTVPTTANSDTPQTVILFGESDCVDESGMVVDPAWRELRSGSGWASLIGDNSDQLRPQFLRTTEPIRANLNERRLNHQRPTTRNDLMFIEESALSNLDQILPFTPSSGEHSQVVTIIAQNTAEFRAALKRAADCGLLENKQIALVTCGDAAVATASLREILLQGGAAMVWTPSRQVTPQAAGKLRRYVEATADQLLDGVQKVNIDRLLERAIQRWQVEAPEDFERTPLMDGGSWVHIGIGRKQQASSLPT